MATQAAARTGSQRAGAEAEDPAHRHHPGRADRRGAARPQAREHHHRAVGEEHVRRARRTRCRATGCCSSSAAAGYVAHFSDGMDARIAVGNEIISLSQLKQTGKIQKRASWVLPLDERSRGKITLGDMTILFQFVTPPPAQPRPQLPASVRGRRCRTSTGASRRRGGVVPAAPRLRHLPAQHRLAAQAGHRGVPDRFVQMIVKKKEKKPEPKKDEVAKAKTKRRRTRRRRAKRRRSGAKKELTEEEKAQAAPRRRRRPDAERRARLAEQVKSTGLLKMLGAKGDERLDRGRARQGRRRSRSGEGVPGRRRRRRRRAATIRCAASSRGGSGSGRVADVGNLRGGAGIAGGRHRRGRGERTVKGAIKTETPAVDGELDPEHGRQGGPQPPRRHQGLLRARA